MKTFISFIDFNYSKNPKFVKELDLLDPSLLDQILMGWVFCSRVLSDVSSTSSLLLLGYSGLRSSGAIHFS